MTQTATQLLAAVNANPSDCSLQMILADALDDAEEHREAALWRVLAEPHKDEHRLAFADVCEREGDVERAHLIRVQLNLATWGTTPRAYGNWFVDCRNRVGYPGTETECHAPQSRPESRTLCEYHHLRRREMELGRHLVNWLGGGLPRSDEGACWVVPNGVRCGWGPTAEVIDYYFERGFVSHMTCSWDVWRAHAAAITLANPIERVSLTTRPDWHENFPPLGSIADRLSEMWPRIAFELPPERVTREEFDQMTENALSVAREAGRRAGYERERRALESIIGPDRSGTYNPDSPSTR